MWCLARWACVCVCVRGTETEIHSEGSVLVRNDDGSLALTKSVGPTQLIGSVSAGARIVVEVASLGVAARCKGRGYRCRNQHRLVKYRN